MRKIKFITAALIISAPAYAKDADILRCTVSNFTSISHSGTEDAGFVTLNKNKTFDIFELSDKFIVMSNSKEFKSTSTEYKKIHDGILGVYSLSDSVISIDTLVVSRSVEEKSSNRLTASVVHHSSYGVNSWYLTCVQIN